MKTFLIVQSLKTGRYLVKEKKSWMTVAKGFVTFSEASSVMKKLEEAEMACQAKKKAEKALISAEYERVVALLEKGLLKKEGTTKSGKQYVFYTNNGLEERSQHCVTLYIAGKCVFTSGDLETAVKYIVTR